MKLDWQWFTLENVEVRVLMDYLRLRQEVFVAEQQCMVSDIDDYDYLAWHLVGRDEAGRIVAGLRLLPPGLKFAEASLGRVVVHANCRHGGTGTRLVREGLNKADILWPGKGHRISAQSHLQTFYGNMGFVQTGDVYMEDGIPHIEMWRAPV